MKPFASYIPTRLYFGAGETQRLGAETARIGKKALLVSGQGSARRSGLLDKAAGLLRGEGVEVLESPGVQPNPRLGPCLQAAELCRQRGIEVIVPVGGGSVLDAAKTIAAAALERGDIWEVFLGKRGRRASAGDPGHLAATGSGSTRTR
jgi:alcohol dehydrogenase YqhD (iron-dependent ADH family)